jgi:multidrug transporter EmrE-like cation transporter
MASAASVKTPYLSGAAEKTQADRRIGMDLIAAVLLAASGHLLIKYGLNSAVAPAGASLAGRILGYILMPRVAMGLAVYGVGTLLWIAAVSKRDISYLYPITALNYVLITLGGMWLFGEPVSLRRWLGILIVMAGVWVLQASSGARK